MSLSSTIDRAVRRFDGIAMPRKLPMVIVIFSVVVAVATGLLGFLDQRSLAIREAENRLTQVTSARLAKVEIWLEGVQNDLITQASNPLTAEVIDQFDAGFVDFADPVADLQDIYITSNPNPTGSKHLLDAGGDGSVYSSVHGTYHGYYRDLLERGGYYDIFLIDTAGNIIYTVFKELDFATNLVSGEYADSGLAEAFRLGQSLAPNDVAFVDYSPYAPSFGAPAAFVSSPVFDSNGERLVFSPTSCPANGFFP